MKYKLRPVWKGYLVDIRRKYVYLIPYQGYIYTKIKKVEKESKEGQEIIKFVKEKYGKKFV